MTASNYTIFKGKHVTSFKLGSTEWSTADFTSTANAIDTTFATNNATPLIDLVGARDSNSPVKSEAWVKDFSITMGDRNIEEEDLLGSDTTGAQNKEIIGGSFPMANCEVNIIYRNNVPLSVLKDTTKCAIITIDNDEGTATGLLNIGMNNIVMKKVGDLTMNPTGSFQQKMSFAFKYGTGSAYAVTQAAPSETWSKVACADYAEEVRLT